MSKNQQFSCSHNIETGCIVQHRKLSFAKSLFHNPMIVWVQRGRKIFRFANGEVIIHAGEMVLIVENQSFDVLNEPDEQHVYQAQWLAISDEWVAQFFQQYPSQQFVDMIKKIAKHDDIQEAFSRIQNSLQKQHDERILQIRTWELLLWLAEKGAVFNPNAALVLSKHIRKIIAKQTAKNWQLQEVASELNMSEATLRRHLAQEKTSFRTLLKSVRMMRALTLLQTTQYTIAQIAYEVGYESPARFTARFRQHFTCTPSDVRKASNIVFNELT